MFQAKQRQYTQTLTKKPRYETKNNPTGWQTPECTDFLSITNKTCIRITQWKRTMKDIPAHQILPSPQLISHVPHDQLCLIFVKTTASHLSRPSHLSSPLFPAFQTQNKRSEVCSWLGQTKQKGSENFDHKEKPIHLRKRGEKLVEQRRRKQRKTGKRKLGKSYRYWLWLAEKSPRAIRDAK